jgi:hypothetical protein
MCAAFNSFTSYRIQFLLNDGQVNRSNMVNMLSARNRMKIRSRQIHDSDLDGVVNLLTKGFAIRASGYWRRALETLVFRR